MSKYSLVDKIHDTYVNNAEICIRLFYPPDVDFYENKEDTPAFSILSVFIPVDSIRQDYRLRIVMTDENQETFSFELTDMVMDLP